MTSCLTPLSTLEVSQMSPIQSIGTWSLLLPNHQSYFDIPVLYATLPEPFGMLAKQELFRLPVFSAAMRGMRCVPIDRGNRRQSFESLRHAAHDVREAVEGFCRLPPRRA